MKQILAALTLTLAATACGGGGGEIVSPATTRTTAASTATASPTTSATSSPVTAAVDVVVAEQTFGHCGQPGIGTPLTGSGNDARKVYFDEGAYFVDAEVEGAITLWVKNGATSGVLEWGDGLAMNGQSSLSNYRMDVRESGDIEFQVEESVIDPGAAWKISFRKF